LGFCAHGVRGVTSEVLLDGSPQITIGFNEPTYVPQPEATQEFNIQTNSLPAEYGRSGGAVINVAHRSGTKNFHGTLYEFPAEAELCGSGLHALPARANPLRRFT